MPTRPDDPPVALREHPETTDDGRTTGGLGLMEMGVTQPNRATHPAASLQTTDLGPGLALVGRSATTACPPSPGDAATVVRSAPVPIIAIDNSGTVKSWNPAAELAFGWPDDEARNRSLPSLIANDPLTSWKLTDHVLSGNSLLAVEVTLLRRDRTRLLARLSASPIIDARGDVTGAIVVFGKVHDQIRLEEALRQAEEREQLLTHFAGDLVIYAYRLEPRVCLDYLSPSAARLLGFSAAPLVSRPRRLLRLLHPDDRRAGLAAFTRPAEHPGALRLRWLRRDGSHILTEVRNIPVHDESGALIAVEGVLRDLSQHHVHAAAPTPRNDWSAEVPVVLMERRPGDAWRAVWATERGRSALGLPDAGEQSLTLAAHERLHPADQAVAVASLSEAAATGACGFRARWLHTDGRHHALDWQCTALPSDSPDTGRVIAAVLDLESPTLAAPPRPSLATGQTRAGPTPAKLPAPMWRRLLLDFPRAPAEPATRPEECPRCSSRLVHRHQVTRRRIVSVGAGEAKVVRYRCADCGCTFSQLPTGIGRGLVSSPLGLMVTVLYGLGLSAARISQSLAQHGIDLAARSILRAAGEPGRSLRRSRPKGLACVERGQRHPAAHALVIVHDLGLADAGNADGPVELHVYQRGETVSAWLAGALAPLGVGVRSLPLGAGSPFECQSLQPPRGQSC